MRLVVSAGDGRSAAATQVLHLVAAPVPQVKIVPLTGKANPSADLVLGARVAPTAGGAASSDRPSLFFFSSPERRLEAITIYLRVRRDVDERYAWALLWG